ncbi:MAG: hypothetical protein AAF394_16030 [Planctomycetota bacterium]
MTTCFVSTSAPGFSFVPASAPATDSATRATDALELPFTINLIRRKSHRLAQSRGFSRSDVDDIQQELSLTVYRACLVHDRKLGAIEPFIQTVVTNRITELARSRHAQRRTPLSEAGSLNRPGTSDDGGAQWVDAFSEKHGRLDRQQLAELSFDMQAALDRLGSQTRQVAELLMLYPIAEVQRRTGTTRSKLRTHIKVIRQQLKNDQLEEYLHDD